MSFVDPLGIALLGATLQPLVGTREVRMDWLTTSLGSYLDRMEVLSACRIKGVESKSANRNGLADSLVELTRVERESEVDEAADRLATALIGRSSNGQTPGSAGADAFIHPLRYSLCELLLNALSHAKREGRGNAAVWVASQYYRTRNEVQLAVVDNGCGILATLKNSAKVVDKTHFGAIPVAFEPFVSCNPKLGMYGDTSNRGVGLTTTERIARAAKGHLILVSGDAGTRGGRYSFRLRDGTQWNGVAISMTCRRDALPLVNIQDLLPALEDAPEVALNFG